LPGTTLAWRAALGAGKSLKGHLQAMCDQTCARIHVYEIKAAALPKICSQDTVDEQMRLVKGRKAVVVLPLPRLPPPPVSLPRSPSPHFPDSRGHGA
jgi:hypothetical protein